MKKPRFSNAFKVSRRLTGALLLSSAAGVLMAAPAAASVLSTTVTPVSRAIDDAGVDLKGKTPTQELTRLTIGPKDDPVFTDSISASIYAGNTPFYSYLTNNCTSESGVTGCTKQSYAYTYGGYGDSYTVYPRNTTASKHYITGKGGRYSSAAVIYKNDGTKLTYNGYSTGSRISTVTKPDGEVLTYHYNSGYLTAIVSSRGYMMKIEGLIVKVGTADVHPSKVTMINMATDYCDPDSTSACTGLSQTWPSVTTTLTSNTSDADDVTYTWKHTDAAGNIWKEVDNDTYDEDSANGTLLHTYTTPEGNWYSAGYTYSANSVSCDSENCTANLSSGSGVITSFSNPDGTWTYSNNGHTSTAPDDLVQTYSGNVFTDANGNATTLYDGTVGPKYIIQAEGDRVDYTYDDRYNVTETTQTNKDGDTTISTTADYPTYTACATNPLTCNKPTATYDANGNETDYTYNASNGMVATKTYPADKNGVQKVETYTYEQLSAQAMNSSGTLEDLDPIWVLKSMSTCKTEASCSGTSDEIITSYTYDDNLLPVTKTISTGDGTTLSTTTTTYDAVGNVTSVNGPASGTADTTYYFYDDLRNQIGTISPDPDGDGSLPRPATYTVYDSDSRPTRVETGTVTGTTSSALSSITVKSYTDYTYDTRGRKLTAITYRGAPGSSTAISATQYSYDIRSHVICTAVRMNPDIYSSLPSSACTLGTEGDYGPDRITKNTYDDGGRLTKVTRAYGTSLAQTYATYTYGDDGEKTSVTDAGGNKTTVTYDGFNRQIKTTFPSTSTAGSVNSSDYETYGYDDNGNMTSYRKRDGDTFAYTYDALNRKTYTDSPDGSSYDIYYDYDLRGLQLSARFGSSSGSGVVNTYDDLGRKLTETFNSKTVTYAYDTVGNRTKITWPDGYYVTYTYDNLNRMETATANGSTLLGTYAYNNIGTLGSLTFGAGNSSVSYGWNTAGQLTSVVHALSGTSYDLTRNYSYNPAGQVMTATMSNTAYQYSPSTSGTTSYTTNGLNQYTALSGTTTASVSYDDNGNLTSDGTFTYTYDAENRMTKAVSSATTASYGYDPLGRRYQKTVGSTTTSYVNAGDELIADYVSGSLTYRYVPGAGTDQPIARVSSGGTVEYFHADRQGSVIALANTSGVLSAGPYSYSAFGEGGDTSGPEFQYTGRQLDPETGLYYYRARYYSPTLGRFLQTDPIGYKDNLNWYAYTSNDPVNGTDPSGRDEVVLFRTILHGFADHQAKLVGNEKDGYTYLSKDGTRENMHFSGKSIINNGNGNVHFDSLAEAFKTLNSNKYKGYDQAFIHKSSRGQDEIDIKSTKEKMNEKYNFINDNCGDAASKGSTDAGLPMTDFTNPLFNKLFLKVFGKYLGWKPVDMGRHCEKGVNSGSPSCTS